MKNLEQHPPVNDAKTQPEDTMLPACSDRCRVMKREERQLNEKHINELQDHRRHVVSTLKQIDVDLKHLGGYPDEMKTYLEWTTQASLRGNVIIPSDYLEDARRENQELKNRVAYLEERFKKQLHLDKMNEKGRVVVDEVILKKKGAVTGKTAYHHTKAVKKAAKKKK